MVCVTTRFRLRYFWQLLPMYLAYRKMKLNLKATSGLIRYAFSIESPLLLHTFSIWESRNALASFSNTPSHIYAVRLAKRHCEAIWSAYWQIDAVSKHANSWSGFHSWPALTIQPFSSNSLVQMYKQEEAKQ